MRENEWFKTIGDSETRVFYCPGCKCNHYVNEKWKLTYDDDGKPTIMPSIIVNSNRTIQKEIRCHFYITNGKFHYLTDCDHDLAGKIVDMEKIKE